MMLQQDEPDDYVIATGESHSVREFLQIAFEMAGIGDGERHVRQDPKFFRPAEVDVLIGDSSKAQSHLGWSAEVAFPDLIKKMVAHDLAAQAAPISTQ